MLLTITLKEVLRIPLQMPWVADQEDQAVTAPWAAHQVATPPQAAHLLQAVEECQLVVLLLLVAQVLPQVQEVEVEQLSEATVIP